MTATEFVKRLTELKNQAEANSKHEKGANGPRWRIVADLIGRILTTKVTANLQLPPKVNQPPRY